MLRNYLRVAVRSLTKNKAFSLLNIAGLSIGMAACFFIFQYVHRERSFDKFNFNSPRIYRLLMGSQGDPNGPVEAVTNPGVGPAMLKDFPEVESFVRFVPSRLILRSTTFSTNRTEGRNISFNESQVYFADPSVFSVFSFPVIKGNKDSALVGPWSIAMSQTTALKYFGHDNPIGQQIKINGGFPGTVRAVFKDIPENSHLQFDILISFPSRNNSYETDNFTWPEFYTYLLLKPGADSRLLSKRFPGFVDKYMSETMKEFNYLNSFKLQPLADIHLLSDYQTAIGENGSSREVSFLTIIGIFVLVIAWINYINLTTAKGFQRAGEIGVRKVVGATRSQLSLQFYSEAFLIYCISLLVAGILVVIFGPFYGKLVGVSQPMREMTSGILKERSFYVISLTTFLGGVFLSAVYPAFVLSRFNPVLVLKGKFLQSGQGVLLKKGLVLFQFILTVLLISGTLLISSQLNFMRNETLGYNNQQLLICKAPIFYDSSYKHKTAFFQQQLLNYPFVADVTTLSDIPGETIVYNNAVRRSEQNSKLSVDTYLSEVDDHFIPTFKMTLAAGRNFTISDSANYNVSGTLSQNVLINNTLAKRLGYLSAESAINKRILFGSVGQEQNSTIVGVIRDFHQKGLKDPYESILYYFPSQTTWKYFAIKVNPGNMPSSIAKIQEEYQHIFTGSPFDSFFLNDFFDQQYKNDQKFGSIFAVFTALAIFVSCLGVLGLASFTVTLRKKEIGVRKLLGASVPSILLKLYRDFFRIVLLSSSIAIPIFYVSATRWLTNYAFHIRLGLFLVIVPSLFLVIITLLTVAGQSFRSATANPIKALRDQ